MASGIQESDFRLGIDFGTSHTIAILRWPDGHTRPILFDGSPLLPSAVYAEADGRLLVGRDAIHAARLDPARFTPTPKREVGRQAGAAEVTADVTAEVTAMVAAVLARVRDEAERVSGVRVDRIGVTLTHPAGWAAERLGVLRQAGRDAGLGEVRLISEPVAAAGYFVSVLGRSIPAGSALVVYDFGGGTFDASAVIATDGGYEVLALAGLDDVGGVDLDDALLTYVADAHRAADPAAWQRLEEPRTPADRRHRRHLIEDVRAAKEMLSRADSATVPVPLLELEARVTREEFDALAKPYLDRTVATTAAVINEAGARVSAVLLVGGSSRIPLVRVLLERGTGLAPAAIDQPETVVAEGSLRLAEGGSGLTRAASALPTFPPANPAVPPSANPAAPAVTTVAAIPAGTTAADVRIGPAGPPVDPWEGLDQTTPVIPLPAAAVAPPRPATVPVPPRRPAVAPVPPGPTMVQAPARYAPPTQDDRGGEPRRPPAVRYQQYRPRTRRRWPVALGAVVVVAAIAAGTVFALPYLRETGTPGPTSSASTSTSTRAKVAYQRTDPPRWVPAGWTKLADDVTSPLVVSGAATNGGTCEYRGTGVVHVTRTSFDVSGCTMVPELKSSVVTSVAVEAEFAVTTGCAGMWARTGARGYFLAVCAGGRVELHELADDPPSDTTRIGGPWRPDFNPERVVVGLLAESTSLMVVVDGEPLQIVLDDTIGNGRVGVGGFAPHPTDAMDATITGFRVWTPAR